MAALHGPQPIARAMSEFAESARAEVAELMLLQMSPDVLGWVELGGVSRQVFQLDRSFEALNVIAHKLTAMSGQPSQITSTF